MYLIHVHQQSKTPGLAILHCTGIVLASRGGATFGHDYLWVCGCWLMLAIANAMNQLHWCILEPTYLNFLTWHDIHHSIDAQCISKLHSFWTFLHQPCPWSGFGGLSAAFGLLAPAGGVLGNFLQCNNGDDWQLHWLLKDKSHFQRTPTSMPP